VVASALRGFQEFSGSGSLNDLGFAFNASIWDFLPVCFQQGKK